MGEKIFLSSAFVFVFYVFINENKTKEHIFNTFRKPEEGATTICIVGKLAQKGRSISILDTAWTLMDIQKWTLTLRGYKNLLIDYKRPMYTTKFAYRQQRTVDSSPIPVDSSGFRSHSGGIHWNPLDSGHSCRNL
jgi:hypothetical protein